MDKKALHFFFDASIEAGRLPEGRFSTKSLLSQLGLLTKDNLNKAGDTLFGLDNPVTVKMALFATDEKITFLDQRQEYGHLMDLIPTVENYILKNINWKSEIIGLERQEIPEIPLPVIREVVANCFAHAKYQTNVQHEICVYPGKITIYNPGSFASPFTPEDYVKKSLPSVTRNALIAKSLYLCKKIEQFGSGLKRVDSLCRDAGLHYSYENNDLGFLFVLNRPKDKSVTYGVTYDVTLNRTEETVLRLLIQNHNQTREELAEKASKTVRTIQRALNVLTEKGYIRRVGQKADSQWEVRLNPHD